MRRKGAKNKLQAKTGELRRRCKRCRRKRYISDLQLVAKEPGNPFSKLILACKTGCKPSW